METIKTLPLEIGPQLFATDAAYAPLLEAARPAIEATIARKTTHFYLDDGNPRHQVDVYPSPNPQETAPVVLYFYGGGLISGNRVSVRPQLAKGLVYGNLAHFFNQKGMDFAVADYRLADLKEPEKGARMPMGEQDVRDAVEWSVKYFGKEGKERKLVVFGASAGALLLSTYLSDERYEKERLKAMTSGSVRLVGGVLLGAPWTYRLEKQMPRVVLEAYYGSYETACEREAMEHVLELVGDGTIKEKMPRCLVMKSEFEAPEMELPFEKFKDVVGDQGGWFEYKIAKGMNHISPSQSPGTGIAEEEEWIGEVVEWMKKVAA